MGSKSKLSKLTKRREFEELISSGQRIHINSWLLFNYKENDDTHIRCGWTIPKYVGTAVVRNRIRRWLREFFKEYTSENWNPCLDLNVVIKRREKVYFKQLEYSEFKQCLERGMSKLQRKIK